MKIVTLFILLCPAFVIAQEYDEIKVGDEESVSSVRHAVKNQSGNSTHSLFLVDRLEIQETGRDYSVLLDAQGWIGKDLNRFWWKIEGQEHGEDKNEEGNEEEAEIQLLYSKALTPFWDLQTGWRHDFSSHEDRDYFVLGVQGLAPYWFEVDAALFISEEGGVSVNLESEYDLLISQRLILQPVVEMEYVFSNDVAGGIGQGLAELELSLRLRYEVKRSFAPYLGVSWSRAYGETASLLNAEGSEDEEFALAAGFRLWF